jgi:hypothetical protein
MLDRESAEPKGLRRRDYWFLMIAIALLAWLGITLL